MTRVTDLKLPTGGAARLYSMPPPGEMRWYVGACRDPDRTDIAEAFTRPSVSALLTHDEGIAWPDDYGVRLAAAVLERGGTAIFAFVRLVDARACLKRLTGGAA